MAHLVRVVAAFPQAASLPSCQRRRDTRGCNALLQRALSRHPRASRGRRAHVPPSRLATSNCDGAAPGAGRAVRKTVFTCPGDDNSHHRRDGAVRKNEGAHGVRNRLRGACPSFVLGMVGGVVRGASSAGESDVLSPVVGLAQVRQWLWLWLVETRRENYPNLGASPAGT